MRSSRTSRNTEPEDPGLRDHSSHGVPRWIARVVCLLFAVFLLLILEGGARLLYRSERLDSILDLLQQDRDLIWRQRSGLNTRFQNTHVLTDRKGWRIDTPPPQPRTGPLIVCVGASPTFGFGVEYGETYAAALQDLLATQNATVLNAGQIGYSTHQGRTFIEQEVLPLRPDVITVSYVLNDIDRYRFFRSTGKPDSSLEPVSNWWIHLSNLVSRSRLARLLGRTANSASTRKGGGAIRVFKPGSKRVPQEEYRRNIEAIVRSVRAAGIDIVLLKMPVNLPIPEEVTKEKRARAETLLQTGKEALQDGRYLEARDVIEQATRYDPYASESYYWLGAACGKLGEGKQAEAYLKKARDTEAYRCARDGLEYNGIMKQVARRYEVPLVDVVGAFSQVDRYLFVDPEIDPIHPNAEGHTIIARLLLDTLVSERLVPATGTER